MSFLKINAIKLNIWANQKKANGIFEKLPVMEFSSHTLEAGSMAMPMISNKSIDISTYGHDVRIVSGVRGILTQDFELIVPKTEYLEILYRASSAAESQTSIKFTASFVDGSKQSSTTVFAFGNFMPMQAKAIQQTDLVRFSFQFVYTDARFSIGGKKIMEFTETSGLVTF